MNTKEKQEVMDFISKFKDENIKFEVEDLETGNCSLGYFETFQEAVEVAENDEDKEEMPLAIHLITNTDKILIYSTDSGVIYDWFFER